MQKSVITYTMFHSYCIRLPIPLSKIVNVENVDVFHAVENSDKVCY